MLLIVIVLYTFGLLMTILVGQNCTEGLDWQDWPDCDWMFGSVPKGIWTMFQVVTLESWAMAIGRPVTVKKPVMVVVFVFFLFISTFGLLNIVVGVVVESTLFAANQNDDLQAKRAEISTGWSSPRYGRSSTWRTSTVRGVWICRSG